MPPRSGERKVQILQVLAEMLQDPRGERITTAALAARLQVSEAALYRHFASKAQMFEGLIAFIEESVFGLVNKITAEEPNGLTQVHRILAMLLSFAERNPGMVRVLVGDALVNEDPRLQARINQLQDRIEATLKQSLRIAATEQQAEPDDGTEDLAARANVLLCYVIGRWHQFAKSGFTRKPTELWERQWQWLL